MLCTDNGSGFVNIDVAELLHERGIMHQRSTPRVPEQNGRVERKHKYLVEMARAIMLQASLLMILGRLHLGIQIFDQFITFFGLGIVNSF